jgi:hypothetical protein
MPWARIPCDKLAFIGQFGYSFEKEDGRNLWYRYSDGKLYCVDRYAPRFWFESAGEAAQAGCIAVRISTETEAAEFRAAQEKIEHEPGPTRTPE